MAKAAKRKPQPEEGSPSPKARKSRASRITKTIKGPPTTLSGVSDYEEDPGRLESQEFLARTKAISKRQAQKQAESVAEFRESIKAQEGDLLRLIEEKKEEITTDEAAFLSTFRTVISIALLPGSHAGTKRQATALKLLPSDPSPASLDYSKSGQTILSKANTLVEKYDSFSGKIQDIEKSATTSLQETWEDDGKEMERTLDVGRKAAQAQINEVVERCGEGGKSRLGDGLSGKEDMETMKVWELGQGVSDNPPKALKGPGMLKALDNARSGGRKLLKGLPVDEE